ncbi:hypothetical protein SDC9_171519 [bioreactor metagenome]|uniref:Uncharacterized protein n=1 Tax=bioreactor metagenome TaxID=1076179 RepID=A0A645GBV3_9ZZZZ
MFTLVVSDHGPVVHLRAGCGKREHHAKGDGMVYDLQRDPGNSETEKILGFPVVAGGERNELGSIDDGAAADGDHEIDPFFTHHCRCSCESFTARVRLDTAEFIDRSIAERRGDLIDQAASLRASAAIGDQHACVLWDLCAQFRDCAFAKQNACRGMQIKVIHCSFPYVGKKRGQVGLPDGEHCGRARLSSQCSFLPMSCPFLHNAGEKRSICAQSRRRHPLRK